MNERLKELAVQAGLEEGCVHGDWTSLNWPDVRAEDLERFADLVRQDYLRELKALKPVGTFAYDSHNQVWEQLVEGVRGVELYDLDKEQA